MSENFWETEVYGTAPLADLERIDMDHVFDWLGTSLPVLGSKVDWSSVRGMHSHSHFVDEVELADEAAREIGRRVAAGAGVDHVGDGLSPYGVRLSSENVGAIVKALLEVPEHHYFLDQDRAWLVVVSSEGDLDILDQLSSDGGS
ncbi:hypothetical protein [Nocardioides sp. WS12]|uniref:hypothetical protein n=1 Tax=Nocardioides sp. WS12 TaxID=2486272 RepID=UPI0015F90B5D|nr:hypothetical protein [Nocardioides sp. WS12]